MDAADQFAEHAGERADGFLERFDAFSGGLGRNVLAVVSVARGGAVCHCGGAAHAAVLLVELAVDFEQLARCFVAAGQQAAAHHAVGEGECFDHVSGFGDAAVGEDGDALGFGGDGGHVQGRHLWDADTGHDAGGADRAGALTDLDDVRAGIGEEFNTFGAGDVAGDECEGGEFCAKHADGVADPLGETVRCGNGNGIDAFLYEARDV